MVYNTVWLGARYFILEKITSAIKMNYLDSGWAIGFMPKKDKDQLI